MFSINSNNVLRNRQSRNYFPMVQVEKLRPNKWNALQMHLAVWNKTMSSVLLEWLGFLVLQLPCSSLEQWEKLGQDHISEESYFVYNLKACILCNSFSLCDINVICASLPHWPHVTHIFHTTWHQPVSLSPLETHRAKSQGWLCQWN